MKITRSTRLLQLAARTSENGYISLKPRHIVTKAGKFMPLFGRECLCLSLIVNDPISDRRHSRRRTVEVARDWRVSMDSILSRPRLP